MSILKKILFALVFISFLFGVYALSCIAYAKFTYYNPEEIIPISSNNKAELIEDTSFSVISWNIGYAGLGAETDFFYDGGEMMNPPKDWVERYLKGIDQTLKNNPVDFVLLQEVDKKSKRSYGIDEVDYLLKNVIQFKNFAVNYCVNYIPLPWTHPMGGVLGGLLTLSNRSEASATRLQLPGEFGFPKQLFFLRRCLLVNRYPLHNGHELVMVNVHNSAYDDSGKLKKLEMDYLKIFLEKEYHNGNYIVVGGDWNQCPPDFEYNRLAKGKEGDYAQTNVSKDYIKGWNWSYDSSFATNRKNNKAYDPATTFTTIIDFYLTSPNIKVNQVKGIETNFAYSDHQPVKMEFELIK